MAFLCISAMPFWWHGHEHHPFDYEMIMVWGNATIGTIAVCVAMFSKIE
jgi:hypothetical protein